ncbi:ATP-dependent Zn protease [Cladophialophora carrionii]|uniref:ATP-dependent Zn protease n=1 Tax=Cladophialophora carrionii TaxID=86049 RepID=A0A1C1CZL3_9EURO|nr:ATP-dependent Zn protease [Cladophialophora carrionii]
MDTEAFTRAEAGSGDGGVAATYFRHATAPRVDTDAVIYDSIATAHPGVPITTVPDWSCNLRAYAAAGHGVLETVEAPSPSSSSASSSTPSAADPKPDAKHIWPSTLRWTVYLPPTRRLDGGEGVVADEVFFETCTYTWEGFTFLVYFSEGRDGLLSYPQVRNQYILGDPAGARALVASAGRWESVLHDEIWVFNQGYWQKDPFLYRSILKSRWEDVILDDDLKTDLVDTVERFFDTRDVYDRLRVPWKRGVIFYGPPGNGKTISIKATMHTLYKRDPPVPTLYVKSLVGFVPAEYSIESIFRKARQEAPCYLVFEDLDSLVTDQVRSFFLNAVDGLSENEGIFMVGSTNHLERLDPGIAKRPSRFDRKYLFPDPDFHQRVKYCHFWQRKLSDNKDIEFPDEICGAAAKITDGFSFAYIQEAFVSALLEIAREKDTARQNVRREMEDVQEKWELLELEGSAETTAKDKDLEDYILWRKLKHQIEMLRKELSKEKRGTA